MSSRRGLAEKVPLALEQACKYIVPVLLTTLLVYLLYVRFDRPPVPPCYYNAKPSTMLSVCGFSQWNPDDITLVPSMNLLLTLRMRPRMVTSPAWDDREQPGIYSVPLPESVGDPSSYRRLPTHIWPLGRPSDVGRLLTTDTQCTGPPIGSPFYPHALSAYVSTSCSGSSAASPARLFVVVSSELRDSIEWFDIVSSAKGPVMSWVGCTQLPPGLPVNRIHALSNDSFIVTTSQPFANGLKYLQSLFNGIVLAMPTGDIRLWKNGIWTQIPNSESILPSGLTAQFDTIYYTEQGRGRVCSLSNALSHRDASVNKTCVNVGGFPSGLHIVAAKNRAVFSACTDLFAMLACLLTGTRVCHSPFSVSELSLRSMKVTDVVHHDGSVIGAASAVVEWSNTLYIGTSFSDRLGVLHLPD